MVSWWHEKKNWDTNLTYIDIDMNHICNGDILVCKSLWVLFPVQDAINNRDLCKSSQEIGRAYC